MEETNQTSKAYLIGIWLAIASILISLSKILNLGHIAETILGAFLISFLLTIILYAVVKSSANRQFENHSNGRRRGQRGQHSGAVSITIAIITGIMGFVAYLFLKEFFL